MPGSLWFLTQRLEAAAAGVHPQRPWHADGKYQIGNKAMKKLFGSNLPCNAKDVMALMG